MHREQKIRVVLFCLSVVVFFTGLPFILFNALGYKFNPRTLRFTKAGLVALRTQPAGASIYLDRKLLKDKTPVTIAELLPGRYHLRVVLEDYYPWAAEVNVAAGKVVRFEKIILFSTRPDIEKLNNGNSVSFWLEDKRGEIYYINQEDRGIYRSDLDGEGAERVCDFPRTLRPPINWRVSADTEKLLCFDSHQLIVVPLSSQSGLSIEEEAFPSNITREPIVDAFWHSDSYHIIVVTQKNIEILEARPDSGPVILANLNKPDTTSFYDVKTDTLYFLDSQQASDGIFYDNIYRLDLNTRFSAFKELMKLRANGQGQKVKKNP